MGLPQKIDTMTHTMSSSTALATVSNQYKWVHCNGCGKNINKQPKITFNLTNCGHIFCQCCSANDTSCTVCKANNIRFIALDENMKAEVKAVFEPPKETLKQCYNVVNFQDNHRMHMLNLYEKFFERLDKQIQELEQQERALKEENRLAIERRNNARTQLAKMEADEERMNRNPSMFSNPVAPPGYSVVSPPVQRRNKADNFNQEFTSQGFQNLF